MSGRNESMEDGYLRPLGLSERLYTARHSLGFYKSVVVTAIYLFESNQIGVQSLVYTALREVILQHAALSLTIHNESSNNTYYSRPKELDLSNHVYLQKAAVKEQSLTARLEAVHDQAWTNLETTPPWKLHINPVEPTYSQTHQAGTTQYEIMFIYHHGLGDGMSGHAFHKSLLRMLNQSLGKSDSNNNNPIVQPPASMKLTPPLQDLIKFQLSWMFLARQAWQEYGPRFLVGASDQHFGAEICQPHEKLPLVSQMRLMQIDSNIIEACLTACKAEKITMTSLLVGVLIASAKAAVPDTRLFKNTISYSLRRFTGTPADNMVNEVSALETDYAISDSYDRSTDMNSEIWKMAHKHEKELKADFDRFPKDNMVGLLPYIVNHHEFYRKKIGKPRPLSFEISNLGLFKQIESDRQRVRVRSMIFSQGASNIGPILGVNCSAVENGPTSILLCWQQGVLSKAVADRIADEFMKNVNILYGALAKS